MFGKSGGECGVEGVGVCEGGEGMSGSGKTEKYGIFGAFVYAWVGFVCAEHKGLIQPCTVACAKSTVSVASYGFLSCRS